MSSSILGNAARSLAGIVEIPTCPFPYGTCWNEAIDTNTRDMLEDFALKATYSVANFAGARKVPGQRIGPASSAPRSSKTGYADGEALNYGPQGLNLR